MQEEKEFYRKMLLIRKFEEKIAFLFTRGKIHGTTHLYIGQEAVATGACAALQKEDFVTSTHRGHGHALARGLDPKKLLAEIMGRKDGYCAGRGGTQHTTSKEHNFLTNGITGGLIPVAAGIALAYKMQKKDSVCLAFLGDGALNLGHTHEAMNLAAVWKLPIIFLCENNLYAMSTPIKQGFAIRELWKRAEAYGMNGEAVDGNDPVSLKKIVQKYAERARNGEGPVLIECRTYRLCGHSRSDQCLYRAKEEAEEWKKRDPLVLMRKKLVDWLGEEEIKQIEAIVEVTIEEATDFASKSPEVEPGTLRDHVFSDAQVVD
jgi:TPP-dependent pyruvate/acetoin dehydrogenase alpha subunit